MVGYNEGYRAFYYTLCNLNENTGEFLMPQTDRHRERQVPIEFESDESLENLPYEDRLTVVFITNGWTSLILNGEAVTLNAPCAMLLSCYDRIKITDRNRLAAKSFSFHPAFLNSALTFETLKENKFTEMEDEHDRNMVSMFLDRNEKYKGYIDVPANMYLRMDEWLSIMGTETFAQSDGRWTCRIRRYLLQMLYLIEDICGSASKTCPSKSPVDIAMEYIHIHYPNAISLRDLCELTNINRTTLNQKFKEKTGVTAIHYLLGYRIKIACEALSHTNLTIAEIAEATGFQYDTYFIKQFTSKIGITPTEYRKRKWGEG